MNELLQKHGCSNVFTVPEGLKELMSDISREVLREQPVKIYDFVTNYLSALLITREHGVLAVKILEELCDCRASVSEHLLQLGLERDLAEVTAQVIKDEIDGFKLAEGKEKVQEMQILKKILNRTTLDEDMSAKVCQVARNAFKDYWYRKKTLEQNLKINDDEPWAIAAQRTLELYKRTKPSFLELNRATQKIQAAYRGYHVRRNLLQHLNQKPKKEGPEPELPGPPLDIAGSREIELGPTINLNVEEDNMTQIFDEYAEGTKGLFDTNNSQGPNFVVQQLEMKKSQYNRKKTQKLDNILADEHPDLTVTTYIHGPPERTEGDDSPKSNSPIDFSPIFDGLKVPRQSSASKYFAETVHKISFAPDSPIIIPDVMMADSEELDIVEEIPDNISDADGASVATASSLSSSVIATPDASDIEDAIASDIEN